MNKAIRSMIIFPLILLTTNLLCAQSEQDTELVNLSFKKVNNQIEVQIECKGDISYESFSLIDPNRLVLDFSGINKVSTQPVIEINDVDILSIRTSQFKPGTGRVVFIFADEIPHYKIEETEKGLMVLFWKEKTEEGEKPEEKEKPKEKIEETIKAEEKKEEEKIEAVPKKIVEPEKSAFPAIEEQFPEEEETTKKIAFGLSSGYYFLQDEAFRDVYGKGGAFLRAEYSFLLPINIKSFDVWTSVSYFQKMGNTTITQEEVKLNITTFSLGLRYLRKISRFTPFAGAGIDYTVYKERYPEDFPIDSVGGSDLGFHIQAGSYFNVIPSLAVKLHIKYNIARTTEGDVGVNLGGVEYGICLIYMFNL